jgi:acyl-CoA synthetase (AMP-forming)/AMP-acid ligase II
MSLDGWLTVAAAGSSGIDTPDGGVSWAAVAEREVAIRAYLASRGVGLGDRFAVLSLNRPDYVAAYLAANALGAVIVPVNTRLKPAEIAWVLEDAGVTVVLADPDLQPGCPVPSVLWEEVPGAEDGPRAAGDPHRPVVQMYTSGTTGRPKGALLSTANLVALVTSWLEEMPLTSDDRTLQVTPLFHVGALMMVLCNLAAGATLCLPLAFKPADALRWLADRRVSHTLLVPAMIRWMLMEPGAREVPFPALRTVVYGASPMPTGLLRDALQVFGCDFLQGYGLTETAGVVTVLRAPDHDLEHPERLPSAGVALSCCEIRVVDPDDRDVAVGVVGEVVTRGGNVTAGYHGRPDATAEALRGGWFHTGDAGYLDADGYLFLVDRIKDMVLVGGENVYPSEVERVLAAQPGVVEVAVFGVPHEVWGEAVMAAVVRSDEGIDSRTRIRACRSELARYKCPTRVTFVEALPRNAAGKVRKAELRAPFWEGRDRAI